MSNAVAPSLIQDENFHAVTARLLSEQYPLDGGPRNNPKASRNPFDYVQYGLGIAPEQGELIYLLCRWLRTKRVAEFATSTGMSTLYLAAAMRDNGGGIVIGSELVSAKAAAARRNLRHVGLSDYAEIREGDARRTLRDLGGPVDFVLMDGWILNEGPSLARQVIEIVAPQVRVGGYVMNENAEPDFLEFVRDPANGFLRLTLPIKIGAELCVKVA
ncbi:methyltransferase [Bradyrhizobium jicamae]|uniref:Methyltransferase n=1 Tax=Bradyrhizobium jicamae TaxID=280332 RepID=A0A0R3LH57_9BRAD|nr:class I SAM-dependent methyltransferase [Bradyrhizobium jicamae]KRR04384.1 methyltransferase [Bradyrhizobium jicamae]